LNIGQIKSFLKEIDETIPDEEIRQLNLDSIIVKSIIELKWDIRNVLMHYMFYKQFLYLCKTNPNIPIVPTKSLDEFWHLHILDTVKYAEDCYKVFGGMLHHFPYFGMRDKQDAKKLQVAAKQTQKLLQNAFQIKGWNYVFGNFEALCGPANCKSVCEGDQNLNPTIRPGLDLIFK